MNRILYLGIDAGSTTVKVALLDDAGHLLYGAYERHRADIRKTLIRSGAAALIEAWKLGAESIRVTATGSGGLSLSDWISIPFVQEVVASSAAVRAFIPNTDVAVELGGEDAKITYFSGGTEQRMNGSCAGGTGSFIDQMAGLLNTDAMGLNELARDARTIYPIAARCGVFAKTDIQPLINEGARREDIAASVFQAVVNQTIAGLACGKPIRGRVAFLGGPLHFLPECRRRFAETLKLADDEIVAPENSQLFVAMGAALAARDSGCDALRVSDLHSRLVELGNSHHPEVDRLSPLFASSEELASFRERHARSVVARKPLAAARGPCFLGVDAGSTTTKLALVDSEGALLESYYRNNGGHPLWVAIEFIRELYTRMPGDAWVARACSTGYGEALVKEALTLDLSEVETIAHCRAARAFAPDVDFLLDIGGQDMKSLRLKDGAITSIQLNEACSSGCGSFLETFALSLDMDVRAFSTAALEAALPVDLGTRCTVFMNSRVKQAQKEGASVADISAGLSYSVVKNALFKVIKLRDMSGLGRTVLVQGGTFLNDAVLRAFELVSGREAVRPDIAGLMGAYGAALLSMDAFVAGTVGRTECEDRSTIASARELENFTVRTELVRCPGCANTCMLTLNVFNGGRRFTSGNRCERGPLLVDKPSPIHFRASSLALSEDASGPSAVPPGTANITFKKAIPNLYAWKLARVFRYEPLPKNQASRGTVGIPRVLNMYENYPLWHTLLTGLGFRVELSSRSTKQMYEMGMETIPSESVCYPAKLAHGHVAQLIARKVAFIFYPCAPWEKIEDGGADNHYNCPIVTSYPEVLRNNVDALRSVLALDGRKILSPAFEAIRYLDPFLPLDDEKRLAERIAEEFACFGVTRSEAVLAVSKAWKEQESFKSEVRAKGEEALKEIESRGLRGIVLAGRPYHVDPEINHGIPELITSLGLAVFTEDSVAHLALVERPLRVVDQWTYHSRLYAAAYFSTTRPDLEFVQLTSFGCGLDAVTSDQAEEILNAKHRLHTLVKIDEGANLGAVRIRLRSLLAVTSGNRNPAKQPPIPARPRPLFTTAMRRTHTVLAPQMSPIHFRLLQEAFRADGLDFQILPAQDSGAVNEGLKFVNNDACYPSILVVGQMMEALRSGRYDPDHTALLVTQTGGGCRATNYIAFIRRALNDAGLEKVPVISLSAQGFEDNPGFRVSPILLHRALVALVFGDLLMRLLYRTRPYEEVSGTANALYESWNGRCSSWLRSKDLFGFGTLVRHMVKDFDSLPLRVVVKPKVGLVGEILVKFHPTANNGIVEHLEAEGAEVVVPDLIDFLIYTAYTGVFKHQKLSLPKAADLKARAVIGFLELYRRSMKKALVASRRFDPPKNIEELARGVDDIVQLGNFAGEGWFLTAEMVELIETGAATIACVQPFACLPNHVTGKGMIKELRRRYPQANIAAIDYDPGASEVNQLNRIKLMLANARLPGAQDERIMAAEVENGEVDVLVKGIKAESRDNLYA